MIGSDFEEAPARQWVFCLEREHRASGCPAKHQNDTQTRFQFARSRIQTT